MKYLNLSTAALILAAGFGSGNAAAGVTLALTPASLTPAAFVPVSTLNFNSGYNATFADNFNSATANLLFNDYYIFTLPNYVSGSGASNAIAGINITMSGVAPTVQLSNFELDTVSSNGNGTYNFVNTMAYGTLSAFGAYPNAIGSLSFNNLAQGSVYALNVAGKVINSNSTYASTGSYSGNVQLNPLTTSIVGMVPEPGEWALMLSGFTLIALLFRNPRKPSLQFA